MESMDSNNKPFSDYDNGADFWRDNAVSYGIDKSTVICGNYLDMNLKREHSDDERQFCREIFAAMYEATSCNVVPANLVYPYDFKTAGARVETFYYQKNRGMNQECSRTIDGAISASCYKSNYYNLELAAMSVIGRHGFERVNAVLAHHIQKHDFDGRYSGANKKWAKGFILPDKAYVFMNSHATLIDGFTSYARKLYADSGANRFALTGQEEQGESESVHGYRILRSIMIDSHQGYAIGHNPDAVSPFVFWQFYIREGERSYNWGTYGDEQVAVDNYNARVFVALN
jgi:hypothetical protein